jgi:acetate kinase
MSRVLVLNAGSSTLKWVVLEAGDETVLTNGTVEWESAEPEGRSAELDRALARIPSFDAVGHRVVHGGPSFSEAVLVDRQVRETIVRLAELAPLHNQAALAGIDAVTARFPGIPQVAAFDTAFHATLPLAAREYALPREWVERWGLRRYGFHGLSVSYAVRRVEEMLGHLPERLIVCHLGAGCSVTAVRDGLSVDTSMGFTPLEGLMMATRSGDVDPGLLLFLLGDGGVRTGELAEALNERSGLRAVAGSADFRQIVAARQAGDPAAELAYAMFTHRLVRAAGGMIAVLGGANALVFTGGIGEHQAGLRADVAAALAFAGLRLDGRENRDVAGDAILSGAGSQAETLVVTAREDLALLAEVKRLIRLPVHAKDSSDVPIQ